jgi:hypothetical protein
MMIVEVFKKGGYASWHTSIFGCKPSSSKLKNIDTCGMKDLNISLCMAY